MEDVEIPNNALTPLYGLPHIEFEDVASENRRFVLLNLGVHKTSASIRQIKGVLEYVCNTDSKALIYDTEQFDWLHARVSGPSGGFTTVFFEVWLAATEIDCTVLVLKYPKYVKATIMPENIE